MDLKSIWAGVINSLETEIGADSIEMWIKPAKPLVFDNNILKLEVPDQVLYQTIRDRYEPSILAALKQLTGNNCSIEYAVSMGASSPVPHIQPQAAAQSSFSHKLNPNYTFDMFIEGPSNRFAYGAAQAVVKNLGERTNNPLVIHSNPGLGKTHLLHSIGNEIIKNSSRAKVLYMSGEEFVNEYIISLQNKTSESFRNKYRNLDCFLVDDIQFVAGKEASEKEFFYTFNTLFDSKKQIVLTSDRMPSELSIDERLASRLLSGIVSEIKTPDLETRIAILRQKREANKFNIPDDVITFMATGMRASIREMEGCLYRLNSYCTIHNIQPTVDIAKEVLTDIIVVDEKPKSVNLELIKKIVAKRYKINLEDFISQKRNHSISWPRQIAMYLANDLTDMSLNEIGSVFNRDHSTVVHARDQIKEKLETDPFFAAEMNQIIMEIKTVEK